MRARPQLMLVCLLLLGIAPLLLAQPPAAETAVNPTPAAPVAAEPSPDAPAPQPDPALQALADRLSELLAGKPAEGQPIEPLFTLSLVDLEAVARRLVELPNEIRALQDGIARLEQRLADPTKEVQPPEPPGTAPEPPPPLTQATAPGETVDGGPADGQDGDDGSQAAAAAAQAEYERALAEYEAKQLDHQQAQDAHQAALAEYGQRLAALQGDLSRELVNARLSLLIAQDRQTYLQDLATLLRAMPEPARTALGDLVQPRKSLRDQAAAMDKLAASLDQLQRRLNSLEHRAQAGALIGFVTARQEVESLLTELRQALTERQRSLVSLTAEWTALADALEADGAVTRRAFLAAVRAPDRQTLFDQAFSEHLRTVRRLSKTAARLPPATTATLELAAAFEALVPTPQAIDTASSANDLLLAVKARLEEFDGLVVAGRAGLDRWRLAFAREQVTLYSALASEAIRQHMYSLSAELVSDLASDALLVWQELVDWSVRKWNELRQLPTTALTREGGLWLLRLLLAVAGFLALVLLRDRLRGLVSWGVRRLKELPALRKRAGGLIRWAGFAQAMVPIGVVFGGGYLAMALIGFELPEVRFVEVAFFWLMLYALGAGILLGLTRQVSRGRPALIRAPAEVVTRLRLTYGRLGLMLALVAVVQDWSRNWLGAGSLGMLLQWFAWLWLVGWGLWALFAWRRALATAVEARATAGSISARLAAFIGNRWWAAPLSLWTLTWLALVAAVALIKRLAVEGGLASFWRARSLRRRTRQAGEEPPPTELPERYVREFPLYPLQGEDEALLLPREQQVERIQEQLATWRQTQRDSSLVLLGEKGAGKTTLLNLLAKQLGSSVVRHTFARKLLTEKALLADLGPALGLEEPPNIGVLAAHLNKGDERVVLLDEVHNLFLRVVDGYEAYEALVRLVNFTSEKVFWVLVFNSFAWEFLNQSRKRLHYFRRLLTLAPWSQEELQELIARRNKRAGLQIEFDDMLLDEERSGSGSLEVIESAEGYFRLLREASGGNPRVATYLWLQSLRPLSEEKLRVTLFREPPIAELSAMDIDLLFALAAVCQHENLSVDELRRALNTSLDFAGFAVRFLTEYDFFEPKHTDARRVTLAPRTYRQVLRVLRNKHLLFEKE